LKDPVNLFALRACPYSTQTMEEHRVQRIGNWIAVLAYGPIGTLILAGRTREDGMNKRQPAD
jgi:hypothetical protein